jgi:hypothetical protein
MRPTRTVEASIDSCFQVRPPAPGRARMDSSPASGFYCSRAALAGVGAVRISSPLRLGSRPTSWRTAKPMPVWNWSRLVPAMHGCRNDLATERGAQDRCRFLMHGFEPTADSTNAR